MKYCSKCDIDKEENEFGLSKSKKDGLQSTCKKCAKEYRDAHKDKVKEYNKQYSIDNRETAKQYYKEYYENKREEFIQLARDRYTENKDDLLEKAKIYYINNKEEINKKKTQYTLNRLKIDPLFKLKMNIRTLIKNSFKNQFTQKKSKTANILGCTYEEFKEYLEKQFTPEMNWNNQGSYWHMDHKKPISLASNEQEVYELNHYTNFQPLFWRDNLSKSNKYIDKSGSIEVPNT